MIDKCNDFVHQSRRPECRFQIGDQLFQGPAAVAKFKYLSGTLIKPDHAFGVKENVCLLGLFPLQPV